MEKFGISSTELNTTPVYDDPTVGEAPESANIPLLAGNPADRGVELTFAEQYLEENPEFDVQLGAIEKIRQIKEGGHVPIYEDLFRRETEERVAANIQRAGTLYASGLQDYGKALIETSITERENARAGRSSKGDQYQTVAEMSLSEALSQAASNDPLLDTTIFSAELISEAAKDRAAGSLLEDALQESIRTLEKRYDDSGVTGKTIDTLGNLFDFTKHLSIKNLVDEHIKDPEVKGEWYKWMTGMNHYDHIAAFGLLLRTVPPKDQLRILDGVVNSKMGFLGLSHNPKTTIEFLEAIKDYTLGDAAVANLFRVLDSTVVVDVALLMKPVLKAAQMSRAVSKALGTKEGGKVKAGEIIRDGAEAEASKELDKVAEAPTLEDTGEMLGASQAIRDELNAEAGAFLEGYRATLLGQGYDEPTVELMLKEMGETIHDPNLNPSVRGIILGDSNHDIPGYVLFHDQHGRSFATREAAEAWAKSKGLQEYEIVSPRAPNEGIPVPEELKTAVQAEDEKLKWKTVIVTDLRKIYQQLEPTDVAGVSQMAVPDAAIPDVREAFSKIADDIQSSYNDLDKKIHALDRIAGEADIAAITKVNDDFKLFKKKIKELKEGGTVTKKALDDAVELWAKMNQDLNKAYMNASISAYQNIGKTLKAMDMHAGDGVVVSPALKGTRIEGALRSIVKTYGLEDDLLVYTAKEAQDLGLILKSTKTTKASAYTTRYNGNRFNFVVLGEGGVKNTFLKPDEAMLSTLAHELGHIFDYKYILKNPELKEELLGTFNKFMEAKNGPEWRRAFLHRNSANIAPSTVDKLKAASNLKEFEASLRPGYVLWQNEFKEWWADQFMKHAFTNVRSTSGISKFFKESIQRITDIYRTLAKALGLGDTAKYSRPLKAVREMLDAHVERIAAGEIDVGRMVTDDLDFTQVLKQEINGKPAKPRIKLKVEAVAKASREITAEQYRDTQGFIVRAPLQSKISVYNEATFDGLDTGILGKATDPRSKVIPEIYHEGVIKEYAEERLSELHRNYLKRTLPSNKKDRAAVERYLSLGDAYSKPKGGRGKVFTVGELQALGGRLNDDIIKGYYGIVQYRRLLHQIHDETLVRELRARGYKNYSFANPVRTHEAELAGPSRNVVQAKRVYNHQDLINKRAYAADGAAPVEISQELLDSLRQNGGYILELRRPRRIHTDGQLDRYVVVDGKYANEVSVSDITSALGYRPGEIARYYTDPFFVDMRVTNDVGGKLVGDSFSFTVRTAPDVVSAKRYVDSMNEALGVLRAWRSGTYEGNAAARVHDLIGAHSDAEGFIKAFREGDFDSVESWSYRYDRQTKDDLLSIQDLSEGTGGVLRSSRDGQLPTFDFEVNPGRENIAAPFESIYNEARTVTRYASSSDLRTNQLKKFISSFSDLFPDAVVNGDPWLTWQRIIDRDLSEAGTRRGAIAENAKNYLKEHLGILDKEEMKFVNSMVERMTRWQLDFHEKDGSKLKKAIADMMLGYNRKGITPINFLRGLNFNLKLGLWNPAQLLVQAQGGLSVLGISPKNGFKAWSRAIAYRIAADAVDNPAVLAKIGEALGKSGGKITGMSADEFRKVITAMKDSGILSNMAMSAFHNTDTVGKLRNASGDGLAGHRFFYNRGEEFTRITAWETARLDWIAKNPGLDWASKPAQKEILELADNYMFNMTKANRAAWQKGIASVPLQFLQWNIKFHNQMFRALAGGRSNLTRTQAIRLLGLHYLAYGTRGNAFGNFIESVVPDDFFKGDAEDEKRLAFTQGLFSLLIKQIVEEGIGTGDDTANLALGARLGTTRWLQEILEGFKDGGPPAIEAALGPSGSILKSAAALGTSVPRALAHTLGSQDDRLAQVISMFYPGTDTPSYRLMYENGNTNMAEWTEVLADLSEVSSGLNNVTQAFLWKQMQGWAQNKQGARIAKVSNAEIWGKAIFGANPQSVEDTWVLYRNKKDHETMINDIAKRIAELQNDELRARRAGNMDFAEEKARKWRMFYSSFEADIQAEVRGKLIDAHGMNDSLREKLILDYFYRPAKYEQGVQSTNPE